MATERIRRAQNQKEYEQLLDEYITLGYKIKSRGETTCNLQKSSYGGIVSHIIIFCVIGWGSFLIGNILWLVYNYYSKSDKVLLKIEN